MSRIKSINENFFIMKILICCFWKLRFTTTCLRRCSNCHFFKIDLPIYKILLGSIFLLLSKYFSWFFQDTWSFFLHRYWSANLWVLFQRSSFDLMFGTKFLFLILWIIINSSFIFVKETKIFVFLWIWMLVYFKHFFVCSLVLSFLF